MDRSATRGHADRTLGQAPVRRPAAGRREDHQAARPSIHRDRNLQGEVRKLRVERALRLRRERADSDHGAAPLRADRAHRSAVCGGPHARDGGAFDRGRQADSIEPPSRRRQVPGGQSGRDHGHGARRRRRADRRAGAGLRHRADHLRHRDHEHHAGDGDRADPRDRPAHGRGRGAPRRAGAVPGGGDDDQRGRRRGGHR